MIVELNYQKGYTENGKKYPNRSLVKCNNCHETRTIDKRLVKTGSSSRYCRNCILSFGTKPRTGREEYEEFERQTGYKLLGSVPSNIKDKTLWQCPKGHQYETSFAILKKDHGCSVCYGHTRRTEKDYLDLANELGIKYIGPFPPPSSIDKSKWTCALCETIFERCYSSVKHQSQKHCLECSYKLRRNLETEEDRRLYRKDADYMGWVLSIYREFDYTCQKCSKTNCEVHAHHIFNWKDYPELRRVFENGILLCKKCHVLFHGIYGVKNNNLDEIEEFVGRTVLIPRLCELKGGGLRI